MSLDTPILSLQLSACSIDFNQMEARTNGSVHPITPIEAKLLAYLARCSGYTIHTDELLRVAFGYREGVTSTAVKNTVYRLRKKIELNPNTPAHLITVRGLGYRLDNVVVDTQPSATLGSGTEIRFTNLPAQSKELIGRDEVVRMLLSKISEGSTLLSLTGTGGIGKTVVAQEVGRQCAGVLPGGSWFCDLRKATCKTSLIQCLETGLEVAPVSGTSEDSLERLGRIIESRGSILVILDNAEHFLKEIAALATRWHETYPQLRLLVTTQRRLDVPKEEVLNLSTLSVEEGVRLFRTYAPSVELSKEELAALGRLVLRYDGLPLALELAAKWTHILSPVQLLAREKQRLDYLQTNDGHGDHQTLAAVIGRSWSLLSPDAKSVLIQCARFPNGFTVTMAESILRPAIDTRPILTVLRELTDCNLLFVYSAGGYRHMYLHQSVQLYLQQMSEYQDESDAFWHRFGRYFSTFGDPARLRSLEHDEHRSTRNQMVVYAEQFALARTHMMAQNRPNLAAQCTLALCFIAGIQRRTHLCYHWSREVLEMRGLDSPLRSALKHQQAKTHPKWQQGVQIIGELLDELSDEMPLTRGRLLATQARLHLWNFDLDACEPLLTEALNRTLESEDRCTEAFVRLMMGVLHRLRGNLQQSLTDLNRALIVADAHKGVRHADILSQLGRTYFSMGHIRDSLQQFEQIVARFGAEACALSIHESVATLHVILGNQAEAERATERMIQFARKGGNPKNICNALSRQAGPLMLAGKYSQALACLKECYGQAQKLEAVYDWQLIIAYDCANIMAHMRHPDALSFAVDAYQKCRERSHTMLANCALAVARAYHNQGQYKNALDWVQLSLKEAKAQLGQVRAMVFIGIVLTDMCRTEEAARYLERAQPILRAMDATPLAVTSRWAQTLASRLSN